MTRLGYARVSTADQDTELQIRELEAAGCERIYRDQGVSGIKTSRPELDKMLGRLSKGDEVVVWKLDRLGRNTRRLLELLDNFKAGMAIAASQGRKAGRREVTAAHPHVKQAHLLKNRD